MTISATYTKLCTLNAATSGITSAPEELPGAIDEASLPCVLTAVGPAEWNEQAVGLYRQVRSYELRCYVKPVADGLGPDEGYKLCLAPLYALGRTYVQRPTLDDTVDHLGDQGEFEDSGVQTLTYGGKDFHGFVLTLRVTEKAT